ncbi:MAG: hypothetical protein ACREVA_02220 [Burkholderiales bacterium]
MCSSDTIKYVAYQAIPSGLSLLPRLMNTSEARVMLLAIGLQESRFEHRVQAETKSYWQFTLKEVHKIVKHSPSTTELVKDAVELLGYTFDVSTIYNKIEDNDTLAVVVARLLLYKSKRKLPVARDAVEGGKQYVELWQPGYSFKVDLWEANFKVACNLIY